MGRQAKRRAELGEGVRAVLGRERGQKGEKESLKTERQELDGAWFRSENASKERCCCLGMNTPEAGRRRSRTPGLSSQNNHTTQHRHSMAAGVCPGRRGGRRWCANAQQKQGRGLTPVQSQHTSCTQNAHAIACLEGGQNFPCHVYKGVVVKSLHPCSTTVTAMGSVACVRLFLLLPKWSEFSCPRCPVPSHPVPVLVYPSSSPPVHSLVS